MIVVDTNVVAYRVLRAEGDRLEALAAAALMRDPEWAAPPLWRSEFCNVLAMQVVHAGMPLQLAAGALADALALLGPREMAVDPHAVLGLAIRSGCTASDCELVSLAGELGTRLVTTDKALLKAFPRVAVSLQEFAAG